MLRLHWILSLSLVVGIVGCSSDDDPFADMDPPEVAPFDGKSDGVGRLGPPVANDNTNTQVWAVLNQWEDTDTPAAREAGIAWNADSGLNWDEKFSRWVATMKKIKRVDSSSGDSRQDDQTETVQSAGDAEMQAMWLRRVQTEPADFLRAKFAYQYSMEK